MPIKCPSCGEATFHYDMQFCMTLRKKVCFWCCEEACERKWEADMEERGFNERENKNAT